MGECGLRGAYAEVINVDPQVKAMLFKLISAMLCPTVHGQVSANRYLSRFLSYERNPYDAISSGDFRLRSKSTSTW